MVMKQVIQRSLFQSFICNQSGFVNNMSSGTCYLHSPQMVTYSRSTRNKWSKPVRSSSGDTTVNLKMSAKNIMTWLRSVVGVSVSVAKAVDLSDNVHGRCRCFRQGSWWWHSSCERTQEKHGVNNRHLSIHQRHWQKSQDIRHRPMAFIKAHWNQ